jgi:hypothetical protein
VAEEIGRFLILSFAAVGITSLLYPAFVFPDTAVY